MRQDTERLDKLQRLTKGYGLGWILRVSTTGRGMRLHESVLPRASTSVRGAIDYFDEQSNPTPVVEPASRLSAAEDLCRLVEDQLAAWDALYPDRKDDSPDNRAVREAVAKWRETLK